jgi:hypothetical protein
MPFIRPSASDGADEGLDGLGGQVNNQPRHWPTCQECDYRSLDEDEFVVGSDDGFRCNVCDEDREAERELEVRDEHDESDG